MPVAFAYAPVREWFKAVLLAVLVGLPFVSPLVGGFSVNVWQLLTSWTCASILLVSNDAALPARRVMALLGLMAAAIVLSPSTNWTRQLAACFALVFVGTAAAVGARLSHPRAHRALALGLLWAGLISALLGLLQYYELSAPLRPWTNTPALGQAYGNLRQRNLFATLISLALITGLWLYATSEKPRLRRLLPWAAVLLTLAAAAATSRIGLLEWFVVVFVTAWMAWRARREQRLETASTSVALRLPHPLLLLALIPAYFAAAWLLPTLAGGDVEGMFTRLHSGAPNGHSRVILWSNVIDLIRQHPWRGWGWGELSFAHYSTLYAGPRLDEIIDNAHNLPLHLAVELGIPAALLIVGVLAWMVIAAKPWQERDPTRLMVWGLLAMIGMHSLVEYPLWSGPFQLVFGICLGMLWPGKAHAHAQLPERSTAVRLPAVLLASVLMAMVGYAGWDYSRVSEVYLPIEHRAPAYRDNPLAKVEGSWLYSSAVLFAELALKPVTTANAPLMYSLAKLELHDSPQTSVIVKLIESAKLLGLTDEVAAQTELFKRAFPTDYAKWVAGKPLMP